MYKNWTINKLVEEAEKKITEQQIADLNLETEEQKRMREFQNLALNFLEPYLPSELYEHIEGIAQDTNRKFHASIKFPLALDFLVIGFLPETSVDEEKCYNQLKFSMGFPDRIDYDSEVGYYVHHDKRTYYKLSNVVRDAITGYQPYLGMISECEKRNKEQYKISSENAEKALKYSQRFETWKQAVGKFGCVDPECIIANVLIDVAESLYSIKRNIENKEI